MPGSAFFRLLVASEDRSEVWSDDLACDEGLNPRAEFRDWHLDGLVRVPSR